MIRTHFLSHSIVYVFFAVALFAASLLVLEWVDTTGQSVSNFSSRPAVSALNQRYDAVIDRWSGAGLLAERLRQAEVARWNESIHRARSADAWIGLKTDSFLQNSPLSTTQLVDAARWTGLAMQSGVFPMRISPQLELLLTKTNQ